MPKVYSVTMYRTTPDPVQSAAYRALALPALAAHGGRIIARGAPVRAYEAGLQKNCVIIEWDSVEQFTTFYESVAYQTALAELRGVERDVRVVEGV